MNWSSSVRDHEKELDKGRVCAYCGATTCLSTGHIIPVSRAGVGPRIAALLDSSDPKLVLSKFLKLAYRLHDTQGTLDLKDPNMEGVLDIHDLGVVITHLIMRISDIENPLCSR
jgi:hypothetical protein